MAWGDLDNDGYLDLHISNSDTSLRPYVDFVYRNNGPVTNAGPFTRMTTSNAGEMAGDLAYSTGSAWVDLNNDNRPELVVYRVPKDINSPPVPFRVYLNQWPDNAVPISAGDLTLPAFGGLGTWGDFDNDGWLDFHETTAYAISASWPASRTNRLFRGGPDVVFQEVRDSVICRAETLRSNESAWADYDGDNDLDLVVANAQYPALFFQNQGNGQFVQVTNTVTQVTSPQNNPVWADFDNDGDLDLLITGSRAIPQSYLYRNDFPADFSITFDFGVNGIPSCADFNNDGLIDVVISRGQATNLVNYLFLNTGNGTFTSVADPVATLGRWCAAAWGDYDNDGFMDLFITSPLGSNALFHNLGNATNHWIKFTLRGVASNGSAIGAKVRIKATIRGQTVWQMRQITTGGWPQDDMRPNFGLADATSADLVRIEWPSGIVQEMQNVAANQIVPIVESQGYTGARPQIGSAAKTTGGIELSIAEPDAGARYIVEASTNLLTWTKLLARTSTGGTAQFTDTKANSHTKRFYRLQVP